jgi:hypothetical protein
MLDRQQVEAAALDGDWSPALDQATLAFATAVCFVPFRSVKMSRPCLTLFWQVAEHVGVSCLLLHPYALGFSLPS